jgi:hypothetical protein
MYTEPWNLPGKDKYHGPWTFHGVGHVLGALDLNPGDGYMLYCGPWIFPTGRACIVSSGISSVWIKIVVAAPDSQKFQNTPLSLFSRNLFVNTVYATIAKIFAKIYAEPPKPAIEGRLDCG